MAKRDNPAKRHLASNVKAPTALDALSERSVVSRCAAGNDAMGRRFGIALESFGYAVGATANSARGELHEAGASRLL